MAGAEAKPDRNPNPEEFQYIIVSGSTSECHFRVKRQARLLRMKNAYVERAPNASLKTMRFRYDGWVITDDDTPESLGMPIREESIVDAYEVRILPDGSEIPEQDAISKFFLLTLRDGNRESVMRVKCSCRFRRIRQKYAQRVGACVSNIEFLHGEKKTVDDEETPESLGMAYGGNNLVDVNWLGGGPDARETSGRRNSEDIDANSTFSGEFTGHERHDARMQVLKQIFTLVSGEQRANLLFDVMGYNATNTPTPDQKNLDENMEEYVEEGTEQ